MLDRLFSVLPKSAQRSLTAWAYGVEPKSNDLDDMRNFDAQGPFAYIGGELVHRDRGYASFLVEIGDRSARWGVTIDAIRPADPQWKDLFTSLVALRNDALEAGRRLLEQHAFEKDGSLLIRDLKVQA